MAPEAEVCGPLKASSVSLSLRVWHSLGGGLAFSAQRVEGGGLVAAFSAHKSGSAKAGFLRC